MYVWMDGCMYVRLFLLAMPDGTLVPREVSICMHVSCMYVCMYVCVYVLLFLFAMPDGMHTYIHTYIHACIHITGGSDLYHAIRAGVKPATYMHTYIHTYIHAYI